MLKAASYILRMNLNKLNFTCPHRTRGSAIVNHVFLEDRSHVGPLGNGLEKGKLVSFFVTFEDYH